MILIIKKLNFYLFITGAINVGSAFFRFEKECAALNASLLKRSIKCRNAKLSLALFRSIRSFGDKEISEILLWNVLKFSIIAANNISVNAKIYKKKI